MRLRAGYWVLALFVLADLVYSFIQNYQLPLDGDLAAIVMPGPGYARVLQDPFGWAAFTQNAHYGAPNRYFAHALLSGYFRHVPLWLQAFLSPIDSVYAAAALFKTLTQALLLYVLVQYSKAITKSQRYARYWLAAALWVPLFQGAGYNGQMGIIDHSITYTCFYAFPLVLLLFWLLPYFRAAVGNDTVGPFTDLQVVVLGLMAIVLAFNGPVIPGAIVVLGIMILVGAGYHLFTGGTASAIVSRLGGRRGMGLLLFFGLLCLYSLYIGRNNSENPVDGPTLWERYKLLPLGVFYQVTGKLGLPLLLLFCLLNNQLLKRFLPDHAAARHLRMVLRWVGWFALGYVLLLPLGGYRVYRPYLLRRDTVLPVILALVAFYGISSYYLLTYLPARAKAWYAGAVLVFGVFL
ncbi:hypothetical protein [Hymenobacter sp. DG25B]|uniref:hypothetical protein n=1 Tax=Hymenobacter sp. DG25B TaxID=1385664 RepID=UPI0012E08D7F|nr:hypothetical protein [Hymenobacter sp. DG25B]